MCSSDLVERIEAIVQRLLDFARPRPLQLEQVPSTRLAAEAIAMSAPLLQRRAITLEQQVGEHGQATALADRKQIGQALLNLILNAAYVTPDGGTILVQLRRRTGQCGLAVVDSGPGIPPELRTRVLDPFFSTKPEGEGTGLGLSVTRSIVDAHGGELTFEFPQTGGTTATIWLREAPAGDLVVA